MIKMIMMKVDGGRKMIFFCATEEGAIVRVQSSEFCPPPCLRVAGRYVERRRLRTT